MLRKPIRVTLAIRFPLSSVGKDQVHAAVVRVADASERVIDNDCVANFIVGNPSQQKVDATIGQRDAASIDLPYRRIVERNRIKSTNRDTVNANGSVISNGRKLSEQVVFRFSDENDAVRTNNVRERSCLAAK